MKISLVLGLPNPFPGAAWTRINLLAITWSKQGHSIEVLGTFTPKSVGKRGFSKRNNINLLNLNFHIDNQHPSAFIVNTLWSFVCSVFYLIARRPDIMVVSVPSGDVGLGTMIACKIMRTKYLVDYRDEWEDLAIALSRSTETRAFYSTLKSITGYLYGAGAGIVPVTSNFSLALAKRGLRTAKIMPNGADTAIFKPLSYKNNPSFTMFYAGGIGGYYRLDIVLQSIKLLIDRGFDQLVLKVAGDGEVHQLLALINKLDLRDKVIYLGAISDRNELSNAIANADLALIPYDDNILWKNSVPAKFFEYCACGVPIVATAYDDSLLANMVKANKIGVICPPLNVATLAGAIYQMYVDRDYRFSAGQQARLLVERNFNRTLIALNYLNFVVSFDKRSLCVNGGQK